MEGFKDLSRLLKIQGAIDVVQIHIQKPRVQASIEEYYSYKSKAYNMQM
jgi:predicted CoA-binding protein